MFCYLPGRRWAGPWCSAALWDGGPDCLPRVPVNPGQEVMDPKLGSLVSSWKQLCCSASCCKSSAWKTFFFSFLLDWFFLALLKLDLGREFKSLPHQCLGVLICHENKGAELQWWMSGQLERSVSLIEACQELDWSHRNKIMKSALI